VAIEFGKRGILDRDRFQARFDKIIRQLPFEILCQIQIKVVFSTEVVEHCRSNMSMNNLFGHLQDNADATIFKDCFGWAWRPCK